MTEYMEEVLSSIENLIDAKIIASRPDSDIPEALGVSHAYNQLRDALSTLEVYLQTSHG